MEWLNSNSGAVQGISTVVLVIITAISLGLTVRLAWTATEQAKAAQSQAESGIRMAEEMRLQTAFEVRPILDIRRARPPSDRDSEAEYLTPDHIWCELHNIGRGAAINISARLSYEVDEWSGLQNLGALAAGARSGPMPFVIINDDIVVVEYSDISGSRYRSQRRTAYDGNIGSSLGRLTTETI
jgi:hypothetical protein